MPIAQHLQLDEVAGRFPGRILATLLSTLLSSFLSTLLSSFLSSFLSAFLPRLLQQRGLVVQRPLAYEGQAAGFRVRAQFADPAQRLLDRCMLYLRHRLLLSPVLEKGHPPAQRPGARSQPQPVGLLEFDQRQLQDVPERHLGLALVAHFETPQRLLLLRRAVGEQVEVQQVNADRRAEGLVVLARPQLLGEHARQIVQPALGPGAGAAYLDLDVVAVAGRIAGQHVEEDVLAAQLLGTDAGIEDLHGADLGQIGTQVVDQRHQQLRRLAEQALEDVVVLRVEQVAIGHGFTHRSAGRMTSGPRKRPPSPDPGLQGDSWLGVTFTATYLASRARPLFPTRRQAARTTCQLRS